MDPTNSESLKAYKEKALQDFHATSSFLQSKRVEIGEKYIDPAAKYAADVQRERPIATAALAIFFATSFFPVLTFLFFAVGTILVAAITAFFWIGVFVGGAALLLLGTLVVTGAFSLTCVFWGLMAYATMRLGACVLNGSSLGDSVQLFRDEMNILLLGTKPMTKGETTKVAPGVYQANGAADEDVKVKGTD